MTNTFLGIIVTLGCGSSSSENCTYFENTSGSLTGSCRAQICRCSSSICQIRLDLTTFVITGRTIIAITQCT